MSLKILASPSSAPIEHVTISRSHYHSANDRDVLEDCAHAVSPERDDEKTRADDRHTRLASRYNRRHRKRLGHLECRLLACCDVFSLLCVLQKQSVPLTSNASAPLPAASLTSGVASPVCQRQ